MLGPGLDILLGDGGQLHTLSHLSHRMEGLQVNKPTFNTLPLVQEGCGAATKILGAVSAPAPLFKYRDMMNL